MEKAKKAKPKAPRGKRASAKKKKLRAGPLSLHGMTFDEAMRRLVKQEPRDSSVQGASSPGMKRGKPSSLG